MPDQLLGGIEISEILADPRTNGGGGFDTDGNGTAGASDEFVELRNSSDAAIDISGVELWDPGRGAWFTFPAETVLQPGASATVVRNVQNNGNLPEVTGDNLVFDADLGGGVFNNTSDQIVVYDPVTDTFISATYSGFQALDPATQFSGFSATATQVGTGEDFGAQFDGFSIQRTDSGFSNDQLPTPGAENVCFAEGALIMTPDGLRPIGMLKAGDLVVTQDAGEQPIRWLFANRLTHLDLLGNPNLRPVVLPTKRGMPDLRVSRHHRLLVKGPVVARLFGDAEVLVPAKDLVGRDGVAMDDSYGAVTYYHMLLDGHHIINANGIAAETLYLGPQALGGMTSAARREIHQIFPMLRETDCPPVAPTRPLHSGKRVRSLARRHAKNGRAIVAAFAK